MINGSSIGAVLASLLAAGCPAIGETGSVREAAQPLYVLINNHVEGDYGMQEGDPACAVLVYQTAALPAPGPAFPGPSFALDISGTELIREILDGYSDAAGRSARMLICPAAEFWQTEADPTYGGRLFDAYDYSALGDEFGIQGHGVYYSGQSFCWYNSPHTQQGIAMKLTDLHLTAQTVTRNGQPVNAGLTLSGGTKLESPDLGVPMAEWSIDHVAFDLGYRTSFDDHDGHVEDEPAGINNERCSYYLYQADYGDGTRMLKIDMNGGLSDLCSGNTARCETSAEAIARLDATLAARAADPDPERVYYLAFATHAGGVWADYNRAAAGLPMEGEGQALLTFMDALQERVNAGADVRFVTPAELRELNVVASPVDSPFGFHPAGVYTPGYPDNGYIDAENIGITWARQGVYAFWFVIQPDLNNSVYDFSMYDQQWSDVPQGMNILANISPQGPIDEGRCLPGTWTPVDIPKYLAFVEATVERYDGDGVAEEDFPGGVFPNPIKYWQVANEPNASAKSGFEDLQCITYQAIKSVCPECVVLNGGVAGLGMIGGQDYVTNFETTYEPILQGLAGQCVDVFDFHWYGNATGDYRFRNPSGGEDVLEYVRGRLAANGFASEMPIWITEMGTYSGNPPPPIYDPTADLPPQTERQQAGDYFKRFLYSLSRGVEKIFPAFGVIEGFVAGDRNYFDHTGLIYNGIGQQDPDYPDADPDDLGLGVKKLGYYTYKKMTEMLEGADWSTITLLRDGTDTDWLYLIRVIKDGQPIHIAWWDYFDEPGYTPGDTKDIALTGLVGETATVTTVVPSAELGQDVTNYATAFDVTSYPITGGSVTIPLGEGPVIVETTGAPGIPTVSEWGIVVMGLLLLTAGTIVISGPRQAIQGRAKMRSLLVGQREGEAPMAVRASSVCRPAQQIPRRNKMNNLLLSTLVFVSGAAGLGACLAHQPRSATTNSPSQAGESQVWFTPNVGSLDMLDLFTEPQSWTSARSKIDVFKFYGWVLTTTAGNTLAGPNILSGFLNVGAFSLLEQWGIEIAVEGPVKMRGVFELVDGEDVLVGCRSREVWVAELVDMNGAILGTASSEGIDVRYVALDEPLFKTYPFDLDGNRLPCTTDTMGEIADDVAAFISQVQSQFPSVLIGDIEPYPSMSVDQLEEWIIALEARGVALPFFHLDFSVARVAALQDAGFNLDPVADLQQLSAFLEARNIAFGVIYFDGTWASGSPGYTDQIYYELTIALVRTIKSAIGVSDHTIFQSWIRHPWGPEGQMQIPINLPENDAGIFSHTRLINEGLAILHSGDFDFDGDVDVGDYGQFETCFTGPGGQLDIGCEPGDFDGDDDVDCDDWGQFVPAWTEPGTPPDLVQCSAAVPTVSAWGMCVMTFMMLTTGTIVLDRRRRTAERKPKSEKLWRERACTG